MWINSWLSGCMQQVDLDAQASDPVPVLSGMPQGSVLAQVLFFIFINDLPDNIRSSVRLFADDCVLYRNIHSLQDCLILQEDLTSLEQWEADWQMKFNVAKCHSMRVTRHQHHKQILFDYSLHNQTLENVQSAKYLGITITDNMDWGQHVSEISSKVSKGAKIRNRYNQVPHLTQGTNGKVTNAQLDTTNESQEVSPFPAGDHKAHINRRAQRHSKHKKKNIKDPQKKYRLGTVSKIFYWRA